MCWPAFRAVAPSSIAAHPDGSPRDPARTAFGRSRRLRATVSTSDSAANPGAFLALTIRPIGHRMSAMINRESRPLVWLHGEVRTPPLSPSARLETGVLLRRLQRGESLGLPHSRPLPSLGPRCHELRILDESAT